MVRGRRRAPAAQNAALALRTSKKQSHGRYDRGSASSGHFDNFRFAKNNRSKSVWTLFQRKRLSNQTGSKIPPLSRRIADLNSQGFDPIAKVSELADHSCSARLPRPFANGRTPFLITDPAMQNYPDQPAEPMGNRPDGLLVSQARHQAAIHDLEDASFDLDRGVGTLIENTPHVAVAFRGAVARGHLRALFVSGACANPRRKVLLRRKRRCRGPHFGQDL